MSPHLSSRSDEVVLRSLAALLAELPAWNILCDSDNNIIAHLLPEQLLRHPLVVHLQHNSESQGNARKDEKIP